MDEAAPSAVLSMDETADVGAATDTVPAEPSAGPDSSNDVAAAAAAASPAAAEREEEQEEQQEEEAEDNADKWGSGKRKDEDGDEEDEDEDEGAGSQPKKQLVLAMPAPAAASSSSSSAGAAAATAAASAADKEQTHRELLDAAAKAVFGDDDSDDDSEFEGFQDDEVPDIVPTAAPASPPPVAAKSKSAAKAAAKPKSAAKPRKRKNVDDDEDEEGAQEPKKKKKAARRETVNLNDEDLNTFQRMELERKMVNRERKKKRDEGDLSGVEESMKAVKGLKKLMVTSFEKDQECLKRGEPAIYKIKNLAQVAAVLRNRHLHELIMDEEILSEVYNWLLPEYSALPHLKIRNTLIPIVAEHYSDVTKQQLKDTRLGHAVYALLKHPQETAENKRLLKGLVDKWSRQAFALSTNFNLAPEDREELDRRIREHTKQRRRSSIGAEADEPASAARRPTDPGFALRARVPQPAHSDYTVRPKQNRPVAFEEEGKKKTKAPTKLAKLKRTFMEHAKSRTAMHASNPSASGGFRLNK